MLLPQFFFNLDNFFFKKWVHKEVTFKGTHLAFLVVFVVGICSRTRSLAFSGSRSRFWLLLMLQAIHHFRSNFFKRRYGSKITAPNYTQKIFPTTTHFWVITPVPPVLLSNRKVLIHCSCKVSSYKKFHEIFNLFLFFCLIHSFCFSETKMVEGIWDLGSQFWNYITSKAYVPFPLTI